VKRDIAITPPLFAIALGFAGLSGTWRISGQHPATVVGDLFALISAVLVVMLATGWITQLVRRESSLASELRDPVLDPSVPVLAITAMLLSTIFLVRANSFGRTLVVIFAVLTLVGGLAVVAAWFVARLPLGAYHPGFYLPTAGGSLIAAQCVTELGWIGFAQALFFIGLASWLTLGVVTSLRLIRAPLALALRPVLAIEIAAPALAGNTYLVVFQRFDRYAFALAAVTIAMGLVQFVLIPYYRHAPFGPAFWVSAFSYATTATFALRWINHEVPTGAVIWRAIALTLATAVVTLLSAATVWAIAHDQFLPRRHLQPTEVRK
jgi:tellurite resistance protein